MKEIMLTDVNFEEEVLESEIPVLVDFFAVWCGPCKLIAPILAEIAEEYEGRIKVVKLDVDTEPELTAAFGIQSIPTVMAFSNGQIIGEAVGLTTKEKLISLVEKN